MSSKRKRVILTFEYPNGKRFKSAKDVERVLQKNNLWERVQRLEEQKNHSMFDEPAETCKRTPSMTRTRLNFDIKNLVSLGWKLFKRESRAGRKRTLLSFEDPSGKKYKSGKDVEKALKEKGT